MPKKKKSGKPRATRFTKQARADLAKLVKTKKQLDLELRNLKQDFNRMMLWVHKGAPFVRRKRKRK
jgi:hypothetical protein